MSARIEGESGTSKWQPIATAPRDFSPILAAAQGIENTGWMLCIVRWAQVSSVFLSSRKMDLTAPDCDWLGAMGNRYGVEFTHWMPLPAPPATGDLAMTDDMSGAAHVAATARDTGAAR